MIKLVDLKKILIIALRLRTLLKRILSNQVFQCFWVPTLNSQFDGVHSSPSLVTLTYINTLR